MNESNELTTTKEQREQLAQRNDAHLSQRRSLGEFDATKKAQFLEMYRKKPNATAIAEILGITRACVYWNLQNDEEFKRQFEEAKESLCDNLEERVYEYGQKQQSFMDRIAWLRAHRPDKWNPEAKLTVQHNVDVFKRLAQAAPYDVPNDETSTRG